LQASSLFLTVTGSAGSLNIIYSQWNVVLFFLSQILVFIILLVQSKQEHDFIGLTLPTLINIRKIKSDELKNNFDYLPNNLFI
jgi:hypothetical protein